jgi:hypothetical protein
MDRNGRGMGKRQDQAKPIFYGKNWYVWPSVTPFHDLLM